VRLAARGCHLFYTKLRQERLAKQNLPRQRCEARRQRHHFGAPEILQRVLDEQQTPGAFPQDAIGRKRHHGARSLGRA